MANRDASITLEWADDTYHFRLGWGEIAKLQEECDAGPYVILQRLYNGEWKVQDIVNIIRLGLIGGGLEPAKALKLVNSYVKTRPPMESLVYAQAILSAGCVGAPEEEAKLKKEEAPSQTASTISQMGRSDLEQSTELGHA